MGKFRKKPLIIEARQFTREQLNEVFHWIETDCCLDFDGDGNSILKIQTLEGEMTANLGDWIIRGVKGEFYPCKPDIFAATYEPIADDNVGTAVYFGADGGLRLLDAADASDPSANIIGIAVRDLKKGEIITRTQYGFDPKAIIASGDIADLLR